MLVIVLHTVKVQHAQAVDLGRSESAFRMWYAHQVRSMIRKGTLTIELLRRRHDISIEA